MTDSSSGPANDSSSFDAPLEPVDAAIADDLVISDEPVVSDGLVVTDDLERTQIFGLDFVNAESLDAVIVELLNAPRRDDDVLPVVLTPNVDILVHLDEDQHSIEADLFRRAQYCLPDGQPLVIASRFIGERLRARLPGSGLFSDLWPQIVADKVPVLVVASSDVIAERLGDEHPDVGLIVPPMFDVDDKSAIAEIVDEILISARAVRPSMIFVGIGNPKDARIIAALFERWDERIGPKPLCLGLGGSFAMYLGLKKRAPAWVQKIGMEWFFRFTQEPRRLFHRYFVRDMAFFNIARREWLLSRSGR
ncbi:MAG: WecB/TagA/CpsF family glycosyltransferase [Acidimicrobiales bacterium]